jgi:hypothetical protein
MTSTQELSLWDFTSGLAIVYRKQLDGAVNGFAIEEADQHNQTFVRRIAFNSRPSNQWQFVDVGLVGTASDSEQLAHLIEAAYGISLSENGRLQIVPPAPRKDLFERFAANRSQARDSGLFAQWICRGSMGGRTSPLERDSTRKSIP